MPVLEGESGIRPLCYIIAKDRDNMFRLGLLTYYPELETWNIRWGKRQYKHLRDCYHISSTKNDLPLIRQKRYFQRLLKRLELEHIIDIAEVYASVLHIKE